MIEERYDEERFEFGERVRLTRNVRNDGTYPGMDVGDFLLRRGSVGNVIEVGTFLQDQVIYTVHFMDAGRMVGCRAEELISADAPWNPSRFEFRDQVVCTIDIPTQEGSYPAGTKGEILKVLRDSTPLLYHVRFPGKTMQVPESVLEPADPATFKEPEE